MLIATQGKNVAATRQYFESVLTQGDYYLGQEVAGQWHGRGADLLGLGRGSDVTREQFAALLAGRHPETRAALTQRLRNDRRPGVDLTFSIPKSVSLAWAICGDERIVAALRDVVRETMDKDVEPLMSRRVRDSGRAATKERTQTGKLIYADFLHKTSRPVDGTPDPHLHIHAFVINWTEENGKHYAGEFEEIVRQRPSLQAKFEARLARKLENELGYQVEKVQFRQSGRVKSGWEIVGVERTTIEKFSRRTEQVEAFAREHGITDDAEKSTLGRKTREKKDKGTSIEQLRQEWRSRLTTREREAFGHLLSDKRSNERSHERSLAERAVQYALDHHLYRQSTIERHQVIGTALEQAVTLSPELIEQSFNKLGVIRRTRNVEGADRELVTTREVLSAERDLIAFARDGRGTRKPIGNADHTFARDWLNDQQKAAVVHVLASRDTVMAITGGAGTGKSSLMQEAAEAIRGHGKEVFPLAPSTGAREVLQDKGFANAQTVEHLLRNSQLQGQVKDQILWVDEAGLLDVRSMNWLFRVAKEQNARVVLSGDTRQHSSPRRGEALRLLEREAGLSIARVETIQRQRGRYQQAVALISRGHDIDPRTKQSGLVAGFDMLDRMGKIKEIQSDDRHALLAQEYLKAQSKNRSLLVVAPTHHEAGAVTDAIREGLRQRGNLTAVEHRVPRLASLNLSEAEKAESGTYAGQQDWVVQFHQNVPGGFKRGDRCRVIASRDGRVELASGSGQDLKELPRQHADRFEVYRQSTLGIAVGDKVRFSLGGTSKDGKRRISNGRLDEVKAIDASGHVVLKSGMTVDRDYGQLDLGYVVTSHASQGKDRQVAIAAMGSESLPAINAKQFYVTVSRGSEDVMIFVDDKSKVRQAIARSGEQLSATELVNAAPADERVTAEQRSSLRDGGRGILRTCRERFVSWWRERTTRDATQPEIGRERSFGASTTGFGPSPGLSGSY